MPSRLMMHRLHRGLFSSTLFLISVTRVVSDYCWGLSIHAQTECQGQNITRCREVFSRAKELGACMVRTDVFWGDIEGEEEGGFNNVTSQFYSDYYKVAYEDYGLIPMVILSGAPGWAHDLLKSNSSAFFNRFANYVDYVINTIVPNAGTGVTNTAVYQLWNEMNDPITSGWLTLENFTNNDCKMFQTSGSVVRNSYPEATRFINILVDDELPWQHSLDHYLSESCAHDFIDAIGIDHYPGTWATPLNYLDWSPLQILLERTTNNCGSGDNGATDVLYGKEVGILETGFSNWNDVTSSLDDQDKWFQESIPEMLSVFSNFSDCYGSTNKEKEDAHNTVFFANSQEENGKDTQQSKATKSSSSSSSSSSITAPRFLNIYQLVDSGAENDDAISVEAHFGLTYSDQGLTIKPAFTTLQTIISGEN